MHLFSMIHLETILLIIKSDNNDIYAKRKHNRLSPPKKPTQSRLFFWYPIFFVHYSYFHDIIFSKKHTE